LDEQEMPTRAIAAIAKARREQLDFIFVLIGSVKGCRVDAVLVSKSARAERAATKAAS
jgi:hypothetical protein